MTISNPNLYIKNVELPVDFVLKMKRHNLSFNYNGKTVKFGKNIDLIKKKGMICDVCGAIVDKFVLRKEGTANYTLVPMCNNGNELTRDHIKPKCAGGTNALENLIPMCAHCNSVWKTQFDRIISPNYANYIHNLSEKDFIGY